MTYFCLSLRNIQQTINQLQTDHARVGLIFTDWLSGGFGRGDLSESSHITLHPDLWDATPSLLVPLNQVQTVLEPSQTTFKDQTSAYN